MSFKELFGVIYFMKGDINNDYFERLTISILQKNNMLTVKKYV